MNLYNDNNNNTYPNGQWLVDCAHLCMCMQAISIKKTANIVSHDTQHPHLQCPSE